MTELQGSYDRIIGPIEEQMIRSIWRIVRNHQDAEDAMQDALLAIWKCWDRVCGHPNPQAMVLKMCVDAAYDLIRRRFRGRRHNTLSALLIEPQDQSPTPSKSAEISEQYDELMAAISHMPRRQATAILMRVIEGQSYRDIASVLGCAEVTARKHVARGRDRLQTALSRFIQFDTNAKTPS